MSERVRSVLFLSRRNSVRSILAEALLGATGHGRFTAQSAGVAPDQQVHPLTIELLDRHRLPTGTLRPKHWREFTGSDAPVFDFIFALDQFAADELPSEWAGTPLRSDWVIADPLAAAGNPETQRRAFLRCYTEIEHRLRIFISLPLLGLNSSVTQQHLDDLGQPKPGEGKD